MGYGRFIGRIGRSAEVGGLEKAIDHQKKKKKSGIKESVEKCFSCCFSRCQVRGHGTRRHVPAVQPVTVNYGSVVFPPPSPHFPLVSLSCPLPLFLLFSSLTSSTSSFLLSHSFYLVNNYGYSDGFRGLLPVVSSGYV